MELSTNSIVPARPVWSRTTEDHDRFGVRSIAQRDGFHVSIHLPFRGHAAKGLVVNQRGDLF